jgi:hypothetical protein
MVEKRTQIINLLIEGHSLRSCARLADVSTYTKSLMPLSDLLMNINTSPVVSGFGSSLVTNPHKP